MNRPFSSRFFSFLIGCTSCAPQGKKRGRLAWSHGRGYLYWSKHLLQVSQLSVAHGCYTPHSIQPKGSACSSSVTETSYSNYLKYTVRSIINKYRTWPNSSERYVTFTVLINELQLFFRYNFTYPTCFRKGLCLSSRLSLVRPRDHSRRVSFGGGRNRRHCVWPWQHKLVWQCGRPFDRLWTQRKRRSLPRSRRFGGLLSWGLDQRPRTLHRSRQGQPPDNKAHHRRDDRDDRDDLSARHTLSIGPCSSDGGRGGALVATARSPKGRARFASGPAA